MLQEAPVQATNQGCQGFDTGHLLPDLKRRSARGGAVTMGAQAIKFLLHTTSTMVLSRLLSPSDFGLLAMVAAFTNFIALFKDLGLSMATIQRTDITRDQVTAFFWINLAFSVLLTLLAAALAPGIAWFYGKPQLFMITLAIASTFILGGLSAQHTALLRRQMRLRDLAIIEIVSMTVAVVVGVSAALCGLGYWSLVLMTAANEFTGAAMAWSRSGWRPGRPQWVPGLRPLLTFGSQLTGFSILNYFTRNADNIIIGHMLGNGALGIYTKAYGILAMPISQINGPLTNTMLPALSMLKDDATRYSRYYLQATATVAAITMPIVSLMFVVAHDVILILLGSQWVDAVETFRWLAPAALLGSVNFAPGWLCISLGRAHVQLRWSLISAPVTVLSFLIGIHWGVNGVAAAFSLTWCTLFVVFLYMACRASPVSFSAISKALSVPMASALIAAAIAAYTTVWTASQESIVIRLLIVTVAFGAIYIGALVTSRSGRQLVHFIGNLPSFLHARPAPL